MDQVYAYGIVRTGHRLPPGATGVGSPPEPLRALPVGQLTAVVSAAPAGLLARRRDLLAHQETLLGLAAEGPVIPMRFGSVAPDEETLRTRLADAPQEQLALLERLDGRVEMNLKALVLEDGLSELLREDNQVRRLHRESRARPGYESSIRLGQAIAEGLGRRAARAAARTLERVGALAEATAAGPEIEGCVLNMSFLLGRDAQEEFRAAVESCSAAYRGQVELRLSGPLPCFSFTGVPAAPERARPRARAGPRAGRAPDPATTSARSAPTTPGA
ncbi:GvpL/GvpF family gas vesicle protein [Streptomyces xiamenensis]|uniref:Gas vesicle synthesis protein n=1 Tax=Streptomyces xiamenensis TaxID=408015 RepID=A0A0F7FZS9_9ACTN|nr:MULTISPECIES: GvpL/GvpF family gas vesicle protein [Streptomyces]AKG46345.1 gas vesicle synthesis protein [Streptomyces xiamenensis]